MARSLSPFGRLRLRHKLGLSLSIAALLPVVVASWVAVSVVLRSLEQGLRDDTDRQVHVGLNLLLRNVERLGDDAVRLSSSTELSSAMTRDKQAVEEVLSRESAHLPSSLVQVTDARGELVAERVVGDDRVRFADLRVDRTARAVQAGLAFERRVTITNTGRVLVVRAAAPIVDSSFTLQGVVVVTVPLDGGYADSVKAALGTEVLIFAGAGPATTADSTFLDRMGARAGGIGIAPDIARRVAAGETLLTATSILGHEYSIGYTPLMNLAGEVVGIFGVAVDREPLVAAKAAAMRSLGLGAAGAFVFALGLAGLLSRRITRPIAHLHRGAIAIARGDLDQRIAVHEGDEIGDLATAFQHMTQALKENQERLAARMREIVALHDAGRAVSSVINLDQVLRKIVDSVARVFDVRLCALWVVETEDGSVRQITGGREPKLRLGAARAKHEALRSTLRGDEGAEMAAPLGSLAAEVAAARATLRIDRVGDDARRREACVSAGVTGSLLATPLERKGSVVGVIVIGRQRGAKAFTEADSNLLATFADQAATAVENARLYEEVRAFNEELEGKVKLRTTELTAINAELGRTITELRETQAQLILSERLAGLGLLVAGVAHEINSPSAAIRGSADALGENVARLSASIHELSNLDIDAGARDELLALVDELGPRLAQVRMPSAAAVRRSARELRARLESDAGLDADAAASAARGLAELGLEADPLDRLIQFIVGAGPDQALARADVILPYLTEYVFLHRNAHTIRNAITRIQRIVGALKSYSHLDQQAAVVQADIHEGIEDTLVILDHVLRDITVAKNFADLPPVPVYVDELNQVWTNLIHNAVQALEGQGNLTIESAVRGDGVSVRIIDDGPGIPADVLPRIFEPFYTTKPKGEGTGLGLRIVQQIVEKHHGAVTCRSTPGHTEFEVWLPLEHVEPEPAGRKDPGVSS